MADIRAFRAIRPAKGLERDIAALPYDVYSSEEAREAVKGKKDSFLHIDRPELGFEPGHDMYAPEVYRHAHDLLWQMVAQGKYIQDPKPYYYIYRLTMEGRKQTGFVACASIWDYESGIIKKHENTRAEKEQDRIRHVSACDAQTGPIFLAYRQEEVLQRIMDRYTMAAPDYDFTADDGIGHTGWIVDQDEDICSIADAFSKIQNIYIADGHHRCASAVKVGLEKYKQNPLHTGKEAYNYFLSVLFPDQVLKIYDYNRVVKDLNGMKPEEFLDRLSEKFKIVCHEGRQVRPSSKGIFGLYMNHTWYELIYQGPKSKDPVEALDVSILQEYCFGALLGIADPKTDHRIDFVGGIRGLSELEKRVDGGEAAAFAMYPTTIQELFQVADAGMLMPPKSTWFEPKLRSGLYIHSLLQAEGSIHEYE